MLKKKEKKKKMFDAAVETVEERSASPVGKYIELNYIYLICFIGTHAYL